MSFVISKSDRGCILLHFHNIWKYDVFYFSIISGKGATISVLLSATSMCVYNLGNLMCFILYFKLLSPSLSKRLTAWLSNFHLKNTNHIKMYYTIDSVWKQRTLLSEKISKAHDITGGECRLYCNPKSTSHTQPHWPLMWFPYLFSNIIRRPVRVRSTLTYHLNTLTSMPH